MASRLSELIPDSGPSPEAQLLAKERMQRLAAAVTLLLPEEQALLIRHYGLGDDRPWTIPELARKWRVSKSTMERRLAAIRLKLREGLE